MAVQAMLDHPQATDFSVKHFTKLSDALDYVPLPDNVTAQIRGTWKAQIKDASGKPVY